MLMSRPEERKARLIDKLAGQVRAKIPQAQRDTAAAFLRHYYRQVAPQDLLEHGPSDLYGAAIAHWNLAARRRPGERLVRVYNPRLEEHGWQSPHTVIELAQEDRPFLVDSARMALNRHGLTVHLIVHPVMRLRRDAGGRLLAVLEEGAEEGLAESLMHIEVDRQTDPTVLDALRADLEQAMQDVQAAVEDWPAMRARLHEAGDVMRRQALPFAPDDIEEAAAFLTWLDRDHFTFLGCREYRLEPHNGEDVLCVVPGSGLGILRETEEARRPSQSFAQLPAAARALARRPELLILTKSGSRATVHRPGYMDYVGIKRFDDAGQVVGEWRFLGLYTSLAYNRPPEAVPILRRKVERVMERSGLRPGSHSAKALLNIIETLPRDELIQAGEDELFELAMGILHLQERQRVRLWVRNDPYQRFLSCLVYLPRDRYNTDVRLRFQRILREAFGATDVDFTVWLSESVLARLYLIAHTPPGPLPDYDPTEIEARLVEATRTWEDDLRDALVAGLGEGQGKALFTKYRDAFPAAYRDDYPAAIAVLDIQKMEALQADGPLGMALYRPLEAPEGMLRFKLLRAGAPIALSRVLPLLENMGVTVQDQRPYAIRPAGAAIWIHDIGLSCDFAGLEDTPQLREDFQQAFAQIWEGAVENDGFNRLVLRARLSWPQVVVLRAYCKYLRQTGFAFSQPYMEQALFNHPQIASLLVDLFIARFDPDTQADGARRAAILREAIAQSLDAIPSLDEDRICRRFYAAIEATLRTNYFQPQGDGRPKPYLALKLDPGGLPDLPAPRPRYEIFVYSPRTEGVHLRGGKAARGGIRWSDRLEDFRLEVFGLMKAQMVKNVVIVPVGAKGGFVVKCPPEGDREALAREALACYRTFIRGLLDLTDNRVGDEVVPPPRVVRHDEDDPYLVVAADKGTASFSDAANAIAQEYGFWLGDAFASGGSTGYDHKKMGITARGAWESVKRHFRELGVDVQRQDFTVVGIGSMGGDVFGNGMLLSRHIRLIGAFSHREIFLDPDPDPETSYRERERLFRLGHSGWSAYDSTLISAGGGVFPRSAKSIPLSPAVRRVLQVDAEALPPNELVRALLRAPVDLLWNGGIGTFVKAGAESHAEAGDRSNDAVRIDAAELRCRVIGEGGNLGLTQRARIEFARRGGRLNTDFIDNSGGVDCSDHEVNLKILLDEAVAAGDLTTKQRNALLVEMAEEVAARVVRNNYRQATALSMTERLARQLLGEHAAMLRALEKEGRLERSTWQLPDEDTLAARRAAGEGLTRPELAVLMAYAKIALFEALAASDACEDPNLADELDDYFPPVIARRFAPWMRRHRLRPQIVATAIANSMVNRMGLSFPFRMTEQAQAGAADLARAYAAMCRVFELPALWATIEALEAGLEAQQTLDLLAHTQRLANHGTLWFLYNRPPPLDIAEAVTALRPGVAQVREQLPRLLDEDGRGRLEERAATHVEHGVPPALARQIAALSPLATALDIADIAALLQRPVATVARLYFLLGTRLQLHWLREHVNALPREEHWTRLARSALRDESFVLHRSMVLDALRTAPEQDEPPALLETWMARNAAAVERYLERLREAAASPQPDLALLSVTLGDLRRVVRPMTA